MQLSHSTQADKERARNSVLSIDKIQAAHYMKRKARQRASAVRSAQLAYVAKCETGGDTLDHPEQEYRRKVAGL